MGAPDPDAKAGERPKTPPREGREAVLLAALRRNNFDLDIAGAWLGVDDAGEELVLCHTLPADPVELDNFPETLAALIAEVGAQRSLLQASGIAAGDRTAESQASTLLFRG